MRDTTLEIPPALTNGRAKRRRLWSVSIALILLVVLVVLALFARSSRATSLRYRTAEVERRTVIRAIEASGRLDAGHRIEIAAPVAGQLEDVRVRPGDRVKKGQVLGRIREEAAIAEVRTAHARLRAARSRADEARVALRAATARRERVERLEGMGLASRGDVSAARGEQASAEAAVKVAEAESAVVAENVRTAEKEQGERVLTAPDDGVVLVAPEWTNKLVSPEQGALFVIGGSLESMRLKAEVAEADIGMVQVGQTASFSVPAFPGRDFRAVVRGLQLEGTREGAAVLYPVLLQAENERGDLLPGMTATLHIRVAEVKDALAVPEAALRFSPDGVPEAPSRSRVFVVDEDDSVRMVTVEAGLSDGAVTAVRPRPPDAVGPGDRVIVGVASRETDSASGPGISLGKRP